MLACIRVLRLGAGVCGVNQSTDRLAVGCRPASPAASLASSVSSPEDSLPIATHSELRSGFDEGRSREQGFRRVGCPPEADGECPAVSMRIVLRTQEAELGEFSTFFELIILSAES